MKATQRDFASVAQRAATECRVFFFCGPDEAGASMAADRMVELLADSGERVELSGSMLRKDPVTLGDEARSASLFGGARHILVSANGDEAHDALDNLIRLFDGGEAAGACPVLVVATSATDKSRTAKLLEKRSDSLVAMFYPPDLRSVTNDVRKMSDAAGLKLSGDVAERIARAAGLDIRLAQSEVTKLALYLDASPQSPKVADSQAFDAVGTGTEGDSFLPLVNVVLSGQLDRLAPELARARHLSMNPVGLLLALERRAVQVAQLAGKLGSSGDINGLLEAEQKARRIFWRDRDDLAAQLARWRGKRLERIVERLVETHQMLLADSHAAELLLSHSLAEIARKAAARQ
ncbi:DNA polymerase III subunit delta [Altericroceibacterium xinjiangense]|uniref:DNA polymerase III subunit delta n=1 Tax=Altericroceibacterium xinjiangense TaxID=762261 RepID=UPI000F7F48E6|nr:DNA polymerase III subunit delta [Altericroceibacterium xinjiangense]